jgi:hypothetical protein
MYPYLYASPTLDLNRAFRETGGRGRNDLDKTRRHNLVPHNPGFRGIQTIPDRTIGEMKFTGSSESTAFSREVRGKDPKIRVPSASLQTARTRLVGGWAG